MTILQWCNGCSSVLQSDGQLEQCPRCHGSLHQLTTDLRPVFARERRILEFYGYGDLSAKAVWRGSRNAYYYIDGQPVRAPGIAQLREDLPSLQEHIEKTNNYEELDKQIIIHYKEALEVNRAYMASLEEEALQFIRQVRGRFPDHSCIVSFSGGKDSTVVSDLVLRALHPETASHIFSDTGIEDSNTIDYVRRFRQQHPLTQFWVAEPERGFFDIVEEIGPPSRVMRWCCTILKSGPINRELQAFDDNKVLTFYGVRRLESQKRSQYQRVETGEHDSRTKIGQQITAAPILDWSEFDVWLYILLHGLDFNASYRWGFSRVGCWPCPLNSRWSEFLTDLYFPEQASKWHEQLVRFAQRIGKRDPEEYVDDRAWVRRFGGAGLENRFAGLEMHQVGENKNVADLVLKRPIVGKALREFLKPLGRIDISRSDLERGEIFLRARGDNEWTALQLHIPEGESTIHVTVIGSRDPSRVLSYVRSQATKYQVCIRCTACAAVCPHGAITVSKEPDIYEIDARRCIGCLECVTHFGATGCLIAKSLSVYGKSI